VSDPAKAAGQLESQNVRPWYREPWPWVLMAIPLLAVAASAVTLWLAISHPDYIVVEAQELQQIRADLNAQPSAGAAANAPEDHDGDH
jgi:hypothetical protein